MGSGGSYQSGTYAIRPGREAPTQKPPGSPGLTEMFLGAGYRISSDENRLRDIGKELYHYARSYEELGYEDTVAVVASVMDGFQVNVPKHMRRDDGQHIAAGFARALMLNAAATLEPEEERV